jgi:Zn-dependent peptidase ImmA (M78 family)
VEQGFDTTERQCRTTCGGPTVVGRLALYQVAFRTNGMDFTPQAFARKLSKLRTDFGHDLVGLANLSGIPAERLDTLERAAEEPNGDEILVLADCFKRDYQFLLSDDAADGETEVGVLFRTRAADISPADRSAIAEFSYLCRCQARLEADLGINKGQAGFSFKPTNRYYKGDAEKCAISLRGHLGLERNEVVRDIFSLMRSTGIKVFRRRLESSAISGLFMLHPTAGQCILVNVAEGMERQRFSAAHEWAHALMDGTPLNFSMMRDQSAYVEVRANTFAARFLIPPELLTSVRSSAWTDPNKISEIAARIRMSIPALLYSLADAKLVPQDQLEDLMRRAPRSSEAPDPELEGEMTPIQRERRNALLERGLSGHYVGLCFDAYARGFVTLGLLSEMLLTTASGAHEIGALFGRSLGHD